VENSDTKGAEGECVFCGYPEDEHNPANTQGKGNGMSKAEESVEPMDIETKLDVLLQGMAELSAQQSEIMEQQNEIIEKLCNLGLDNEGYSTEN
jgi:hypothetical protein